MAIPNIFGKDYVEVAQNLGAVGGFAKFTFHNKMLKSSSNEKKKVIESIIHPTSDTKITLHHHEDHITSAFSYVGQCKQKSLLSTKNWVRQNNTTITSYTPISEHFSFLM